MSPTPTTPREPATVSSDRKLIVALDTLDVAQARTWADAVAPHAGLLKLGLEFYLANGAAGVAAITGAPIFLDLKLHDIPNTVAGGAAMIQAAHQAAMAAGADRPMILAVTVLTSLDQPALNAIGVPTTPAEQVLRLGRLAIEAGADGLVCSPLEIPMLRQALGQSVKLVVPGIRPEGSAAGDQARTLTPAQAVAAGADWIVVGRPITQEADPATSAASIAAAIR
jgi:orotidine-5'-phosphate decarboxylase